MKTRQIISFIFFLATLSAGFSQDTLLYHSGEREVVQVVKVTPTIVTYHQWPDTASSPTYTMSASLVEAVLFANGEKWVFKPGEVPLPKVRLADDFQADPRMLSIDVSDLPFGIMTLSYQHSFPNLKNMTIRIPVSTSFNALKGTYGRGYSYGLYNPNKAFSSGVDVMFFPWSKTNHGFTQGISTEFGTSNRLTYNDLLSKDNYGGVLYQFGYYMNKIRHVAFGVYVSSGYFRFTTMDYINPADRISVGRITSKLRIEMGITF